MRVSGLRPARRRRLLWAGAALGALALSFVAGGAVALVTLSQAPSSGVGPPPAAASSSTGATSRAGGAATSLGAQRGSSSTSSSVVGSGASSTTPAGQGGSTPPAISAGGGLEPGGGHTLFPSHRIVAFYGEANDPGLGVLGEAPPSTMWPRLAAQAAGYAEAGTTLVPAYELIAFVAQADPGSDGSYTARIPDSVIASYLSVVRAHHGMLILDIQPGRSSFLDDAQSLAPWLAQPDVGLGLDPEWELTPTEVPLAQIGQTSAAEINQVSTWLEQLVEEDSLPQKLLLVHQFDSFQVQDKAALESEPGVALDFNMDGFGYPQEKAAKYQMLAADPNFALGFKLFYQRDTPLLSPAQVLALSPPPSVIEYE